MGSDLRILMLSDYFPPHFGGGVEHVASRLCHGLIEHGHTVTVMTIRTCPSPLMETNGKLRVHRIRGVDLTPHLGLQQTASIQAALSIARVIREFHPDIIHAHNLFFRTTEAAALLRSCFRIPLITTVHLGKSKGGSRWLNTLIRTYETTLGRFILHRSDHLIAVSHAVADHARSICGAVTPVTVVPNGVDAQRFHPEHIGNRPEKTALFVGRLISNKGPETLIKAAPAVLNRHPEARFVIVGDGPLLQRLQTRVKQMDIHHAVNFLGRRHDVPDLMRSACLFVRPSLTEGMSLTMLEAMASELPIVATPVGGTPELIGDNVCGYLVPVDDSTALANAISDLLDNHQLAREMGRRGRDFVQSGLSWEHIVEKTERIYQEEIHRR